MQKKLEQMSLSPLQGDESSLTEDSIADLMTQLSAWELVEADEVKQLRRTYEFGNFADALGFTIRVGEIAEEEGHHPIITLTWGRATVTWYTHRIGGLHINDFIMAARTDEQYSHQ